MTEHGPFDKPEWSIDRNVWHMACTATHAFDVMPFIFTHAIVVSRWDQIDDYYIDRWCYGSREAAVAAMQAWTDYDKWPDTEPTGWHRHPPTGRRRKDGDPSTEEIRH